MRTTITKPQYKVIMALSGCNGKTLRVIREECGITVGCMDTIRSTFTEEGFMKRIESPTGKNNTYSLIRTTKAGAFLFDLVAKYEKKHGCYGILEAKEHSKTGIVSILNAAFCTKSAAEYCQGLAL